MASSKVNTLSETTTDQCLDQIYLLDYSTTTILDPENVSNLIFVDTNEQIEEILDESMDSNEEGKLMVLYMSQQHEEYNGDLDSCTEIPSSDSETEMDAIHDQEVASATLSDDEEIHECLLTESYEEEIIYLENVFVGRDYEIQYDSFIQTHDQITDSYEIFSGMNVSEAVISFNVCSSMDELEEYGDIEELDDDEEPCPRNGPN
ncbi:uncharacterized protein [Lepeophtheirus salmonis]|uniref:uncharacterized protein n=1 Tax=Lepeophtheirus salmonis TaxID=72036 RepID=UPI001AE9F7E6|nr:uncharacterized protein LOC121128140 [Lepeophtheirus salmonis]